MKRKSPIPDEAQKNSASPELNETQEVDASPASTEPQVLSASPLPIEPHTTPAALPADAALPTPGSWEIRLLVDSYYSIQDLRIENGNRIKGLVRDYGVSEEHAGSLHNMIIAGLTTVEKDIASRIRRYIRPMPIYKLWVGPHVKGVAEVLAGAMIAGIEDIGRFATISKLWKFCGVGMEVVPGTEEAESIQMRIQRKRRGEKITYSPFLRTTLWKIGESFNKIADRGYYGKRLAQYKNAELAKVLAEGWKVLPQAAIDALPVHSVEYGGDKGKDDSNRVVYPNAKFMSQGHLHNRAKRKTVKLFASHLWTVWREIEGLPVSEPYIVATQPNLHHFYAPPGWGENAPEA